MDFYGNLYPASNDFYYKKLHTLRQRSTVVRYKDQFQFLQSLVSITHPHIDEAYFASCCLNGLQEEIRKVVQLFRPITVSHVLSLAGFQESILTVEAKMQESKSVNLVNEATIDLDGQCEQVYNYVPGNIVDGQCDQVDGQLISSRCIGENFAVTSEVDDQVGANALDDTELQLNSKGSINRDQSLVSTASQKYGNGVAFVKEILNLKLDMRQRITSLNMSFTRLYVPVKGWETTAMSKSMFQQFNSDRLVDDRLVELDTSQEFQFPWEPGPVLFLGHHGIVQPRTESVETSIEDAEFSACAASLENDLSTTQDMKSEEFFVFVEDHICFSYTDENMIADNYFACSYDSPVDSDSDIAYSRRYDATVRVTGSDNHSDRSLAILGNINMEKQIKDINLGKQDDQDINLGKKPEEMENERASPGATGFVANTVFGNRIHKVVQPAELACTIEEVDNDTQTVSIMWNYMAQESVVEEKGDSAYTAVKSSIMKSCLGQQFSHASNLLGVNVSIICNRVIYNLSDHSLLFIRGTCNIFSSVLKPALMQFVKLFLSYKDYHQASLTSYFLLVVPVLWHIHHNSQPSLVINDCGDFLPEYYDVATPLCLSVLIQQKNHRLLIFPRLIYGAKVFPLCLQEQWLLNYSQVIIIDFHWVFLWVILLIRSGIEVDCLEKVSCFLECCVNIYVDVQRVQKCIVLAFFMERKVEVWLTAWPVIIGLSGWSGTAWKSHFIVECIITVRIAAVMSLVQTSCESILLALEDSWLFHNTYNYKGDVEKQYQPSVPCDVRHKKNHLSIVFDALITSKACVCVSAPLLRLLRFDSYYVEATVVVLTAWFKGKFEHGELKKLERHFAYPYNKVSEGLLLHQVTNWGMQVSVSGSTQAGALYGSTNAYLKALITENCSVQNDAKRYVLGYLLLTLLQGSTDARALNSDYSYLLLTTRVMKRSGETEFLPTIAEDQQHNVNLASLYSPSTVVPLNAISIAPDLYYPTWASMHNNGKQSPSFMHMHYDSLVTHMQRYRLFDNVVWGSLPSVVGVGRWPEFAVGIYIGYITSLVPIIQEGFIGMPSDWVYLRMGLIRMGVCKNFKFQIPMSCEQCSQAYLQCLMCAVTKTQMWNKNEQLIPQHIHEHLYTADCLHKFMIDDSLPKSVAAVILPYSGSYSTVFLWLIAWQTRLLVDTTLFFMNSGWCSASYHTVKLSQQGHKSYYHNLLVFCGLDLQFYLMLPSVLNDYPSFKSGVQVFRVDSQSVVLCDTHIWYIAWTLNFYSLRSIPSWHVEMVIKCQGSKLWNWKAAFLIYACTYWYCASWIPILAGVLSKVYFLVKLSLVIWIIIAWREYQYYLSLRP